MKSVSSALDVHLTGEVTTLATCWKITRRDEAVFGFTDHDHALVVDGITYFAETGFTPSAMASNASFAVDNLDIEGALSATAITEEDIMAGKYDFAEIEIFQVNYTDLTQGALKLRRGWIGEVTMRQSQFIAEIRGLSQKLSQNIGQIYSPACRATLGDVRCKVSMASRTYAGTVTSAVNSQNFTDSSRTEDPGTFSFGAITFTSGANNGLSMEIKQHAANGVFFLAMSMPYTVQPGDSYNITEGCDKTFETCSKRFDNALNFRGEPHVPGIDRMLETAGTRSEW